MNTSLMFLTPSDRAKVWSAIDRGEIPYPQNGMLPTMLVEWALNYFTPGATVGSRMDKDTGRDPEPSKCSCTKPLNSRVGKCDYCREFKGTKVLVDEFATFPATTGTASNTESADIQFVAGCRERMAKQPPPATEHRRWSCSNQSCSANPTWQGLASQGNYARAPVGTKEPCSQCQSPATVIACTADGTPLDTARPATGGGKRYFKPPPPDCPGYFYVLDGNRVFMNVTGSVTDVTETLPVKSVTKFREITAAEAEALLGAKQ